MSLGGTNHRAIGVVKKQAQVLRRLIDWHKIGNAQQIRDCPVLVIDDESDHASINTGKKMDRDELTRINGLIVELLATFPRCGYVGYTATPFANVLTHPDFPENLYPRSFIYPLDPPRDYFGAERIHGRQPLSTDEADEDCDGLPLIRTVPVAELAHLKPGGRKLDGFKLVLVRQAGEGGQLYGSVSARDIADALIEHKFKVERTQVVLANPIKVLGVTKIPVRLHADVKVIVEVTIARSMEKADLEAAQAASMLERPEDAEKLLGAPAQPEAEGADTATDEEEASAA